MKVGFRFCIQCLAFISTGEGGIEPQTQTLENSSALIVPLTVHDNVIIPLIFSLFLDTDINL